MLRTTIITAASEKYVDSLFALIGSINCNWANHPPIVVYDIGLEEKSLAFLHKANIEVRKVPPFCDHWRKHYTWKIWCINNIETENVIYMDAGICVLNNLDEIIEGINLIGYFFAPNYQFLDWEASEQACEGCGVDFSFRIGKGTIAGNLLGFKKKGNANDLTYQALSISLSEKNIMPYNTKHKQDQSIYSLLIYKHYPNPVLHDGFTYLGWESPRMVENQKIWVHRRGMLKKDMAEYKKRIVNPRGIYLPKDPKKDLNILQKIKIQTLLFVKITIRKFIP